MATIEAHIERPGAVAGAYSEWHRQAHRARAAYEAWSRAPRGERSLRYAAYAEQLDREQRAAELYAAAVVADAQRRRAA